MSDSKQFVNELLKKLSKTPKSITPDKRLVEDLGFDSLTFMDLIAEIEDEFDVFMAVNKVTNITTVGELYNALDHIEDYSLSTAL